MQRSQDTRSEIWLHGGINWWSVAEESPSCLGREGGLSKCH
jgi:hypothetical protein